MVGLDPQTIVRVVAGALVCLAGALVVRYPETSYEFRTGWKHEEASLSDAGRTDERLLGGLVFVVGLGIVLWGLS